MVVPKASSQTAADESKDKASFVQSFQVCHTNERKYEDGFPRDHKLIWGGFAAQRAVTCFLNKNNALDSGMGEPAPLMTGLPNWTVFRITRVYSK